MTSKAIDEAGVDEMSVAMKAKLAKKRREGRGGWQDPRVISMKDLRRMIREHVNREDWVDVANIAMMLYVREYGTEGEKE